MTLQERCTSFLDSLGLPISRFCRKVELSDTAYHRWIRNDLKLSDKATARIDSFLKRYGW